MTTENQEQEEVFEPNDNWEFKRPKMPNISRKKSKRSIQINEVEFSIIKSVRGVTKAFIEFEQECQRTMKHAAVNIKRVHQETDFGPIAVYDRWDYYFDLLSFICFENFADLVNIEEIDMQEAEDAIMAFMPESMRLAATLMGF